MKNYDSGFLIVRSYEWMYQHFWKPAEADQFIYAIPRKGADPKSNEKQYHGISRNPLEAWYEEYYEVPPAKAPEDLIARSAIRLLEDRHLADEGYIFQEPDARDIFSKLIEPTHWELIWATKVDVPATEPANARLLGFEPTWFYSDFFSAIADSMCFPMWHGPDPEGTLFLKYFSLLNQHGLFPSPSMAQEFLDFYRSFDWTEAGNYVIAKVMAA